LKYFNIVRDSPELGSSAHLGETSLNSAKALCYFLPKTNWYANVEKQDQTVKIKTNLKLI
jgi:hypothetical protein